MASFSIRSFLLIVTTYTTLIQNAHNLNILLVQFRWGGGGGGGADFPGGFAIAFISYNPCVLCLMH
jgi:hypothetical protein